MIRALLCSSLLLLTDPAASQELRVELSRSSLTGTHCRERVWRDGVPTEEWTTRRCSGHEQSAPAVIGVDRLLRVDGRIVRREIDAAGTLEPYAIDIDAATGEVLQRTPLFFREKPDGGRSLALHPVNAPAAPDSVAIIELPVRIFEPNPVVALNDPSLQDRNDAASAVPTAAYRQVELSYLGALRGGAATIVDRQPRNVPPVTGYRSLLFNREEDEFEDVHAYVHIQRNQAHLQSLGFVGDRALVPYSIEVDVHAANGADNSYFLPSQTQPGRGTLFFGEGGTDDAEDADLLIHEYGHAILEWVAPGAFGGSFGSESRAIAEGFGDYWAFSTHVAARRASGRDPYCIADWDARCWEDAPEEQCAYPPGSDCLRRVDSSRTMADYNRTEAAGTEHLNGAIWSSALRQIREQITATNGETEGRRITDSIVIESLFGAPPRPTFAVMAAKLVEADRLLFAGAHESTICSAMQQRGIAACAAESRDPFTIFESRNVPLPIPDADPTGIVSTLEISDMRLIENIGVRVAIEHPIRGDLRIELTAPDGTVIPLHRVSNDRTRDLNVTFGIDAEPVESLSTLRGRSAAGVWQLRIADLRAVDVGRLLSWGLIIDFVGESIPPVRPRGTTTQMIPAVASAVGRYGSRWRSELRLANPSESEVTTTLLFTAQAADGTKQFEAVEVPLAPRQSVHWDDVVRTLFRTSGSGSLEILGDVVAMSRTTTERNGGTIGQEIPPVSETTALGEPPIYLPGMEGPEFRFNAGLTEVVGAGGVVRIEIGSVVSEIEILPFSNVQFPVPAAAGRVRVISGGARIAAYVSQIDVISGDAMFVPAVAARQRLGYAPAASITGADGTKWQTDYWGIVPEWVWPFIVDVFYRTGDRVEIVPQADGTRRDIVGTMLGLPGTSGTLFGSIPLELLAFTRVVGNGMSQFVPLMNPEGAQEQHLLFVDNDESFRTNIGIVAAGSALVHVAILDPAGRILEEQFLGVPTGSAQLSVRSTVTGGRAVVRLVSGQAQAWLSRVDRTTRDGTFVIAVP